MRLNTFPAGLGPSVFLVATGGVLLAALPPAEYLGAATAAIVGSALAAFGVGYPIVKKKQTDADIAAFRAKEAAQKGTTLRALDDAQEELRRLHELMAERDRLAAEKDRQAAALIRSKDEMIDIQMRELNSLRTDSERMRQGVIEFAKDVLHQHGIIREEGEAAP